MIRTRTSMGKFFASSVCRLGSWKRTPDQEATSWDIVLDKSLRKAPGHGNLKARSEQKSSAHDILSCQLSKIAAWFNLVTQLEDQNIKSCHTASELSQQQRPYRLPTPPEPFRTCPKVCRFCDASLFLREFLSGTN